VSTAQAELATTMAENRRRAARMRTSNLRSYGFAGTVRLHVAATQVTRSLHADRTGAVTGPDGSSSRSSASRCRPRASPALPSR
jgi:hypothetical protein